MDLLHYVFFYLVAALLLFQGTHALGEQREPMGVVPAELVPARREPARRFGWLLVLAGALAILVGLLSHGWTALQPFLQPLVWRLLGLMGLYGIYVIFLAHKVDFAGRPSVGAHGH